MGAFLEQIMATENLSLALPQAQNALADDVVKIADNFQKLDAAHGTLTQNLKNAQDDLKAQMAALKTQNQTAQTTLQNNVDAALAAQKADVNTALTETQSNLNTQMAELSATLESLKPLIYAGV